MFAYSTTLFLKEIIESVFKPISIGQNIFRKGRKMDSATASQPAFSRRLLVLMVLAVFSFVVILVSYIFYAPSQGPQYPSISKQSRYNAVTGAVALSPSLPAGSCDIFITGPDRQMKYYSTAPCENLDKTTIAKEEFLSFGNYAKGSYTVTIFSEATGTGTTFSFRID